MRAQMNDAVCMALLLPLSVAAARARRNRDCDDGLLGAGTVVMMWVLIKRLSHGERA